MGTWLRGWMLFCSCISTSHTMSSFLRFQSPGLALVSVGGTVELKCLFEQEVHYCYTTTWHKLNLRTGEIIPVKNINENNSPQSDGKTCVLTLNNLTPNNSGLYICVSHYNSMAMVGNGSRVIVTEDLSEPELSVLYSPPEADGTQSIQLQCLVLGAVTSQVQVFWMIGEKKHSGWTESAWTNDTDSATEFTRAHLSIPTEEWTEEEIQCCVEYKGQIFTKIIRRYEPKQIYSWLVYAGCIAALLTIIVTIIMSVGLHQDMLMTRKSKGLTRKDAHRKLSYGKQNTLREESPSVMSEEGNAGVC